MIFTPRTPPCKCGSNCVLVTQVFNGEVQPVLDRKCKECGAPRP